MLSSSRMEKSKIRPIKSWLVKVFDECLDVLYQNLFLVQKLLVFKKTKWYKTCTIQISLFGIPPGDPCVFIYFHAKQSIILMQHLFEFNLT